MSSTPRPTVAPAPAEAHAAQAGLASAAAREDALKTIVDSLMQQATLPKAPHLSVDEALPMHAAESMLRLLELQRLAQSTFATSPEADEWLRRPHPMLEGESPLECAKSAFGAQRVKDMLVALRYGGVV